MNIQKPSQCQKKDDLIQGIIISGLRRRRRPRTSWLDDVKAWTGLALEKAVRAASERKSWRRLDHNAADRRAENSDRTHYRTQQNDSAFSAAAPRLWNSLSVDVVASQSLATFKGLMKTYLFEQSFDHRRPRSLCYLSLKSPGLWQAKYCRF